MVHASSAVRPTPVTPLIRGIWLVFFLLLAHSAQAYELFRWIDSEGRVHFGDRPPPAGAQQVDALSMPSFTTPSQPADEDPYSILNQLGRLEANRQHRERERREKAWADREYHLRRRELEAREQAAETPPVGTVQGYRRPAYPWPPGHWPGRPGYRPPFRPPGIQKPDHPAFRPRPPFVAPHPPPVAEPRRSDRGATINLRR